LYSLSASSIILIVLSFLFRKISLGIVRTMSKEPSCSFNHSSLLRRRGFGWGQARLLWPKADIEDSSRILQRDSALDIGQVFARRGVAGVVYERVVADVFQSPGPPFGNGKREAIVIVVRSHDCVSNDARYRKAIKT
jgi:hypothetical protein